MIDPDCKIIFLDIDGVLNAHKHSELAQSNLIDPGCVARLNRILIYTEAKIVLSSAWRYMVIGRAMSLRGFDYLMRTHGVKADHLIGRTCADEDVIGRGMQINVWLMEHSHKGPYVVIDDLDTPEMENEILKYHKSRTVITHGNIGLTADDADRAIAILKGVNE